MRYGPPGVTRRSTMRWASGRETEISQLLEQADKGLDVIGAKLAAHRATAEFGVIDDQLHAIVLIELPDNLGQRRIQKNESRRPPGERISGRDDCRRGGSRECRCSIIHWHDQILSRRQHRRITPVLRPGDLHASLRDDYFNRRFFDSDIERGAHRADRNLAGADQEWTRGFFADREVRLAAGERHATGGIGKLHPDFVAALRSITDWSGRMTL